MTHTPRVIRYRRDARRLARIRAILDLTMREMAQRLGISERQYGRYERGECPVPAATFWSQFDL